MATLHLAPPDRFAAARALLLDSGFTGQAICARLGIASIFDFRSLAEGREGDPAVRDPLDLLIRLFMDGETAGRETARALLGAAGLDVLDALGLLTAPAHDPDSLAGAVLLYPVGDLFVASDRDRPVPDTGSESDPDGTVPPSDSVYPAITANGRLFLNFVPTSATGRVLDLCSGTGIAALLAARSAEHAWALDIAARSTHFARFNARLNAIHNVTALQGDVFEPVAGLAFDRITAHPPFVPQAGSSVVWRDAGEDGEAVLRRILAGLPDHLRPGGRAFITCGATDRAGAPLEQRCRHMIGERETEFDVVFIEAGSTDPAEHLVRLALRGRITEAEAERRYALYASMGAERIVTGCIAVQRHRATRAPITRRRLVGVRTGAPEAEWLLDWIEFSAGADGVARTLAASGRVPPGVRARVAYSPEAGDWHPNRFRLAAEYPFRVELQTDPAGLFVVQASDGGCSIRQLFARAAEEGVVRPDASDEALTALIEPLGSAGLLELDAVPLPRAELASATS